MQIRWQCIHLNDHRSIESIVFHSFLTFAFNMPNCTCGLHTIQTNWFATAAIAIFPSYKSSFDIFFLLEIRKQNVELRHQVESYWDHRNRLYCVLVVHVDVQRIYYWPLQRWSSHLYHQNQNRRAKLRLSSIIFKELKTKCSKGKTSETRRKFYTVDWTPPLVTCWRTSTKAFGFNISLNFDFFQGDLNRRKRKEKKRKKIHWCMKVSLESMIYFFHLFCSYCWWSNVLVAALFSSTFSFSFCLSF